MNLDRDLADALRPLAGDPVADAARVLAALPIDGGPPQRPHSPWRHWLPWTVLGLALVGGAALGAAIDRALTPDAPPPVVLPKQDPPKTPRAEPTADVKGKNDPPPSGFFGPDRVDDMLLVMAFGPIEIDEPRQGVQQVEAGQWQTELDTRFATPKGQAGIYISANDARVRIDYDSQATVHVDRVALEFGRIWVDSGQRDANLRVDCGGTHLAFAGASGVVARAPSGLEILSLHGTIDAITPLDTVRVAAGEQLEISADGLPGARTKVAFLPAATSWMTRMIEEGVDRTELNERVKEVFAAYEEGTNRDAARRELLKLGERCVWLLADSVERSLARNRDYALETAQLIGRLVTYRTAAYVLPLLLQDDAELRAIVLQAVRDATGTDGGQEPGFWRNASREQRRVAVDAWRRELSR